MQIYKLKVVCILNGSNASGSGHSEVLRDGWGTPHNQPQLVAIDSNRSRFDTDLPPQAA
jgi:hypothetical protein